MLMGKLLGKLTRERFVNSAALSLHGKSEGIQSSEGIYLSCSDKL